MSAGRTCSRTVATVRPEETVRVAARRMAELDVGTLVVRDGDGTNAPTGIVTDRDIAVRCVGGGYNPDKTPVAKIMTVPVRVIDESVPIEDAMERMAETGARRLVVTGEGKQLVGILSLDDVLELLAQELGPISRLLRQQQPHVPA
jgi:CBS domain-containing protein